MKKLKLDHELAQLVLRGEKWTTWRLFDDKDLSVNDVVELIDKVEPDQPQTWRAIGTALINRVVEKRFRDITPQDMDGHEKFSSPQAMLATYQKYYRQNVDLNTPVKLVSFSFSPHTNGQTTQDALAKGVSSGLRVVKLYADGGSRGNPGPSASGFIIMDENSLVLVDKGVYLGITTNNQAEYQALKSGLEEAQKMHAQEVEAYMDSMLVVNQMNGIFKVKNRDLWPIHAAIQELAKNFQKVSFTHVPRELNKLADAAVNRTLDEAEENTQQKLS